MPTVIAVLLNHLYEYRKGVRQLVLLTLSSDDLEMSIARLELDSVDYFVQPVSRTKSNLFFGRTAWVETARRIVTKPLSHLSPEEDFILGTLLGYDREQQCRRFLIQSARGVPMMMAAE
jgi:hypothetical protein